MKRRRRSIIGGSPKLRKANARLRRCVNRAYLKHVKTPGWRTGKSKVRREVEKCIAKHPHGYNMSVQNTIAQLVDWKKIGRRAKR